MNKYIKIIQLLLEHAPQTSSELAVQLNVSIRTIKTYISYINTSYPSTITSSKVGYSIDVKQAHYILNLMSEKDYIPQTSQERIPYILNELLKSKSGKSFNIYDISDDLHVSASTIRNELKNVKRKLRKNDLDILIKGDTFEVQGIEQNRRKMLSSLLYEESNVNFLSLDSIQQSFQNIDIDYIKSVTLQTLNEYKYYVNDYSLSNLVLHIALSVERINNNFHAQSSHVHKQDSVEYLLAKDISVKLGEYFNITFNDEEIYEMMLLIYSRATALTHDNLSKQELGDFVGEECIQLVKDLIETIYSLYNINLRENDFFVRFTLHIHNLIIRSKNNHLSRNPLTYEIKTTYPLIYDMSVSIANILLDKTEITIDDNEIAFIAFHIGSTLETQKNLSTKINTVIFCPTYYNFNNQIIDKIKKLFSNDLIISNVFTQEEKLHSLEDISLIISTVPINKFLDIPVFQTNMFLTEKKVEELEFTIKRIRQEEKQEKLRNHLKELIIPSFFEIKEDLKNEKECINYMTDKMVRYDFIHPSFKDDVFKREELSSTSFGNFAIPHSISMNAYKTGMYILISQKPIQWNNNPVQLIIMMCFNKDERHVFNEIYDSIATILTDKDNVKKIINSKSLDDFINFLVKLS